jgi:hypothetical protein
MKAVLDILGRLNPLIQAGTLIAVIIYVWKTWTMAREMKLSREEQLKPTVVCYFEHNQRRKNFYDFIIKNFGNSMASNVTLVFSPPLERYGQGKTLGGLKEKTFKAMAPGYEWRTYWGSFVGCHHSSIPDEFTAKVSYEWGPHRKHEAYEVSFDIKSLMGITWLGETTVGDSVEEMAKSIKEIADALKIQAEAKQHCGS